MESSDFDKVAAVLDFQSGTFDKAIEACLTANSQYSGLTGPQIMGIANISKLVVLVALKKYDELAHSSGK